MTSRHNGPAVGSVFADPSGRRRRRIRRVGYVAAGGCVTYIGLVAASLTGGPFDPDALLPPGVPEKVEALLNPGAAQAQRDRSMSSAGDSTEQPAAQPDGGDWVNRGTTDNPTGGLGLPSTTQPGTSPTPGGQAPTDPPAPLPTEPPAPVVPPAPVDPPASVEPPPPAEPPPPVEPSPPLESPAQVEPPAPVEPPALPTSPEIAPTGGIETPTLPDTGDLGDTLPSVPGSSGG